MSDKAPPAGWVVQVTISAEPEPAVPGTPLRRGTVLGPPSFKYFNVAIGDPVKAAGATMKHLDEVNETSVVRGLSSEEIAVLNLKAGEVQPA